MSDNIIDVIKIGLAFIGADGLYCCPTQNDACGCSIDDIMPCNEWENIKDCVPAKLGEDGLFVPMKPTPYNEKGG